MQTPVEDVYPIDELSFLEDITDFSFPDSYMSSETAFTSTPKHYSPNSSKSGEGCPDISSPPFSPLSENNSDDTQTTTIVEANSMKKASDQNLQPDLASSSAEFGIQEASCTDLSSSAGRLYGMKLVADNVDKTVKPRYMRVNKRNISMHFMHVYAVQDRISLQNLSETPPPIPIEPELNEILPSKSDDMELSELFGIHVSRILATHMPFFLENFKDAVSWHISHEFSKEMSKKSEVVSVILQKKIHKDL